MKQINIADNTTPKVLKPSERHHPPCTSPPLHPDGSSEQLLCQQFLYSSRERDSQENSTYAKEFVLLLFPIYLAEPCLLITSFIDAWLWDDAVLSYATRSLTFAENVWSKGRLICLNESITYLWKKSQRDRRALSRWFCLSSLIQRRAAEQKTQRSWQSPVHRRTWKENRSVQRTSPGLVYTLQRTRRRTTLPASPHGRVPTRDGQGAFLRALPSATSSRIPAGPREGAASRSEPIQIQGKPRKTKQVLARRFQRGL